MNNSELSYLIVITLVTLLTAAFFAGMEMAFITANRLKIELDKGSGKLSGKILSRFINRPDLFISAMLLGSNASIVVFGICFGHLFDKPMYALLQNTALVMVAQTLLSTVLVLVVAEFLPKTLFQINANRSLRYGAPLVQVCYWLLYLPTQLTVGVSTLFLRLLGVKNTPTTTGFSKVDLDYFVRDMNNRMEREHELDNEIQILQNALDFSKIKARDCMIPRTEIAAVELEESIESLKEKFIETGYTKILVYRDHIDNIIGYVHSFEMFKQPQQIKQILLPVSVVPEAIPGKELLELFTSKTSKIALVVDEFGGTSGIVTIEDVLEEIFGDIEDEYDVEELMEKQIDANTYLFSARHEIDYLNDKYKLNLPESEDYDTLSGLALHHLESIPKNGIQFSVGHFTIEICEVTDRRIEMVKLSVRESD